MVAGGTPDGPVRLRTPAHALDPRALGWWRARCLAAAATAVVPFALAGAFLGWPLLVVAAGCVVLGVVAAATLPGRWYRRHRWEVTDTAVFTRSGYLATTWRFAPLDLVSTADTRTGPLQRAFGLATLVVTTPAPRPLTVVGLGGDVAVDLARRLTDRSARRRT